jgi:hypothetical protein
MAFGIPGITPVEPPVYKLFITHAWDHQEYDSLVDLIKPDATFRWENLSVPKENPIAMLVGLPKSIRTLVHELDNRIRRADCVLIITGMYVAHRQWIQSEIESALDFKKPIVGIAPRGQERIAANSSAGTVSRRSPRFVGSAAWSLRRWKIVFRRPSPLNRRRCQFQIRRLAHSPTRCLLWAYRPSQSLVLGPYSTP